MFSLPAKKAQPRLSILVCLDLDGQKTCIYNVVLFCVVCVVGRRSLLTESRGNLEIMEMVVVMVLSQNIR